MDDQNETCKATMPGNPHGHAGSWSGDGSDPVPDHILRDLALRKNLRALLEDYRRRWPGESAIIDDFVSFSWSDEALQGKANPKRHITASTWILDSSGTRALLTHHAKLDIWVQLGGHTDPGEDWADAALREAREESGLAELTFLDPATGSQLAGQDRTTASGPEDRAGTAVPGHNPGDRAANGDRADTTARPRTGNPGDRAASPSGDSNPTGSPHHDAAFPNQTPLSLRPRLFDLDIHPIPARKDTPAHLHYDLRFLLLAGNPDALVMSDESHDLAWVDLDRLEEKSREDSQLRMRKKSPSGPLPRR